MSEYEKQLNGEWYDSTVEEIKSLQAKSRELNREYNNEPSAEKREIILKKWFKQVGENCYIEPNLFCDFGCHVILGNNVYFNTNCTILDSGIVEIGDNTMIGSGVQLCTPTHPINSQRRLQKSNEKAKPIKIGKNCWLGSSVTVTGGVTIGDNVVIGAGCTINRDIPSDTLVKHNSDNIILTQIF